MSRTPKSADVPRTLAQILPNYSSSQKAAVAAALTLMVRSVHWDGWSASAEMSPDERMLRPVLSWVVPNPCIKQRDEQRVEVRCEGEQGLFRFTATGFGDTPITLDGPVPQELIDIGMQLIRLRSKTHLVLASRAHRRNGHMAANMCASPKKVMKGTQ